MRILIPSIKNVFLYLFLVLWILQWPVCPPGQTQCCVQVRMASRARSPSGPYNCASLLPCHLSPTTYTVFSVTLHNVLFSELITCYSLNSLSSLMPLCTCMCRVLCLECPHSSTTWKIPQHLLRVNSSTASSVKPFLIHPIESCTYFPTDLRKLFACLL